MSRSRISVTPFDMEPGRRILNDLRQWFEQYDQQKKKDLEKLDQLFRELRDGYEGKSEVSPERESELMGMLARISENGRRLETQGKDYQETYQFLRSRAVVSSNDSGSNPREQGKTVNRSVDGTRPAATHQSAHTTHQNQPRGQIASAPGPATTNSEPQRQRYRDLMPENGSRYLSSIEKRKLGDKLLRQMDDINSKRKPTVSLKHCRSEFGTREPFHYRRNYYIARCPVHPDLDMDYEGLKHHYRTKHCVAVKKYQNREAMRYLATRILGKEQEIKRFVGATQAMNDDSYTMRIIPEDEESSRMVTLRTSAIRGALNTTQPEAQSANGTNSNDASAGAAQENAATYSEAAPMADMGDGGDMSPLTEVATENISRELAAGPESWNWTPTWLAAIREATPEPPETSDVPGSISNPLMVLDNEESGDSRGAAVAAASTARDPQTPSPVRVKMQGSPSSRLRRLGVKGVQLSPRVFRSRTPAEVGPSNDARESATQHEEEEQQQQQSPVGDPAWTQQTALPPPSQGESAHAGDDEDEAMGVVEELTDIVNRNFTQHRFILGV